MSGVKRRLVTRGDFDGLACAVLLKDQGMVNTILFVEPWQVQGGDVPILENDITANLPYVEQVHIAFDHHYSESQRVGLRHNLINDSTAPSAARVIWKYYGGRAAFPHISYEMLAAVDQADAAQFSESDILAPMGWDLLNFIIDPRTGLHRFEQQFHSTHEQLLQELVFLCQRSSIEEILKVPVVEERVHFYLLSSEKAEQQIMRCAKRKGSLVIVDFRDEASLHPCNRFMIYSLFRSANLSIQLTRMPGTSMVEIAMGRSILEKTSLVDVGILMLEFGGGGHRTVGTCRVPEDQVDQTLDLLYKRVAESS